MAQKRMFDKTITNSDDFIEMPDSSQNLYFHLSMNADDDGFVNNWKSIMRMTGHKEDDLKVLVLKNYIIPFDSGVIVIKHWRINNYLRSDRYVETKFKVEKDQLSIDENMVYQLDTNGVRSIDKNRIDKNSIEENNNADIVEKLSTYLEQNFSRTISPLEYERLKTWLEMFNEEMVRHAIDLAILNNKKTFSYIGGILKNWKANGYHSIGDIEEPKKENLPEWFDKNIEKEEISKEEQKEIKDILDSFD